MSFAGLGHEGAGGEMADAFECVADVGGGVGLLGGVGIVVSEAVAEAAGLVLEQEATDPPSEHGDGSEEADDEGGLVGHGCMVRL